MRGGIGLAMGIASFAGCAKLDLPPEEPSSCISSVSLDGSQPSEPSSVGPVALGTADVCMHLDASRNEIRAHLAVTVGDYQTGQASGFGTALFDLDGVMLREGWDVQISDRVVHNLEWTLDAGEVRDVVLRVTRASNSTMTAPIQVSLFEPLE
ncbi:MAG: hypothetical protein H0T79_15850 [Deltaproteobacteria bacterium]|nr:hypothetical protein [Deltaproteobacteria bacterium]